MPNELPSFLKTGGLNWTSKGFHYRKPSADELVVGLDDTQADGWRILVQAIERAKTGDFTTSSSLSALFETSPPLNRLALVVMGSIGTWRDMETLQRSLLNGSADARLHACIGAARAGFIEMIPSMVSAWHAAESVADHETIGYALSDLLENEPGVIAEQAGSYTLRIDNPTPEQARMLRLTNRDRSAAFERAVMAALGDVRTHLQDRTNVAWRGRPFGVMSFATDMLARLQAEPREDGIIPFREKFEASTGINCTSFFVSGRFQRVRAIQILEQFLSSDPARAFEEGKRYFFGHPIPEQ